MVHKRTKRTKSKRVVRKTHGMENLTKMAVGMGTAVFAGSMGLAMAGAFKK